MPNLEKQLREINNTTLHNIRFVLESYSTEILKTIDACIDEPTSNSIESIRQEASTIMKTLNAMQTVINHHYHLREKEVA